MRKFLLPIINLVNIILISITWGISTQTAVIDAAQSDKKCGNWYQLVWGAADKVNVIGIVGFFLFCIACVLTLAAFLPVKGRKCITGTAGIAYIASAVLLILTPKTVGYTILEPELEGSYIAMIVLMFIVGAFSVLMSVFEFSSKKE